MQLAITGTWHINGKDYVCYGGGLKAEYCELDLRTPVIQEVQQWIKAEQAQGVSLKAIAAKVDLSLWAIKAIVRGGDNCRLPTQTLYEIKQYIHKEINHGS